MDQEQLWQDYSKKIFQQTHLDEWFVGGDFDDAIDAMVDSSPLPDGLTRNYVENEIDEMAGDYNSQTEGWNHLPRKDEMDRLELFFKELREDLTDSEIAAGLTNGDIEVPEWMGISEVTDHLKAWDLENGGSSQMGFITINYYEGE